MFSRLSSALNDNTNPENSASAAVIARFPYLAYFRKPDFLCMFTLQSYHVLTNCLQGIPWTLPSGQRSNKDWLSLPVAWPLYDPSWNWQASAWASPASRYLLARLAIFRRRVRPDLELEAVSLVAVPTLYPLLAAQTLLRAEGESLTQVSRTILRTVSRRRQSGRWRFRTRREVKVRRSFVRPILGSLNLSVSGTHEKKRENNITYTTIIS
jgi:hypothetical protein